MDAGFSLETEVGKLAASIAEGRIEALKNVEEKSAKESIRCKFFGDLQLKEIPTSFGSAVDVIKTLPQQIQGIRWIEFHLMPSTILCSQIMRIVRICIVRVFNGWIASWTDPASPKIPLWVLNSK